MPPPPFIPMKNLLSLLTLSLLVALLEAGPVRVLFLGHESQHHNSNEYYPILAKALGRDAIYFDYVTTVSEALDDAKQIALATTLCFCMRTIRVLQASNGITFSAMFVAEVVLFQYIALAGVSQMCPSLINWLEADSRATKEQVSLLRS